MTKVFLYKLKLKFNYSYYTSNEKTKIQLLSFLTFLYLNYVYYNNNNIHNKRNAYQTYYYASRRINKQFTGNKCDRDLSHNWPIIIIVIYLKVIKYQIQWGLNIIYTVEKHLKVLRTNNIPCYNILNFLIYIKT